MTMKQLVIIFAVCLVGAYCAVSIERAPAGATNRELGFSCEPSNPHLGLMKHNDVKVNYEPNLCGSAICINSVITHETCDVVTGPLECQIVKNMSKPYPECCPKVVC